MYLMHTYEKPYPDIAKIFDVLPHKEQCAFLDSSLRGKLGSYSIIGLHPYLTLEKGERFLINQVPSTTDFNDYVSSYLKEHKEENPTELPLVGGAIGYFSYDYGRKKEGIKSRHPKEVDIPDCVLTFYDSFIIEDHKKETLTLIANDHGHEKEHNMKELLSLVEHAIHKDLVPISIDASSACVTANFDPQNYMQAVQNMIDHIVEGDIYVVNMTQQLQIHSKMDPYTMYQILRENNPAPFGAYMDFSDFQIVCASPERFLQMRNGQIQTRPIKGTRKRGETPEEDLALKKELENSAKDHSELLMIIDLERNDLNRVCVPGSVKVTELFQVETYATVFHLISNVVGTLQPDLSFMDLLSCTFPGGSITGAPKLRAMEIIDEQEHSQRNLYTGSIGYVSLSGDCDLNIVIRTALVKDGTYHLGVGGGITCDSDLAFEYKETLQKAKALLDALDAKNCPIQPLTLTTNPEPETSL